MYLHICKNVMARTDDIIGIFRTSVLENTKEYDDIKKNIEDASEGTPKSFILMKDKAYLSNISVSTLEKRARGGKNGKIWT